VTDANKLRIVFFGTDDFASTHLKALIEEKGNKALLSSLYSLLN
jgi:methionyl-tRNA formyltransferase